MNKKELLCFIGLMLFFLNGFAQDTIPTKKHIAYDGSEIKYTPQELALKLPADPKPTLDYPIRDVSICLGPDSNFFNGTFWLTYSFPLLGNGILKSTTGKAEWLYVSALQKDEALSIDIDASLFQDDDGKMNSVVGEGKITPMNNDLGAPTGPTVLAKPTNGKHVGFEGAFLFKNDGIYYMAAAEFVNGEYHCFMASSNKIYGPYSDRYLAIPHGGHNVSFKM